MVVPRRAEGSAPLTSAKTARASYPANPAILVRWRILLGRRWRAGARTGRRPSRSSAVDGDDAQGRGGLLDGQTGEVAELDEFGLPAVLPLQQLRGPRPGREVEVGLRTRRLDVTPGRAAAGRRRPSGSACGGRPRPGCGAWPRPRRRRSARGRSSPAGWPPPTSRRYASWTRAVGWRVWPGRLGRQPRGGQLAQLVVDEREQSAAACGSPAAAASSRRVTSDIQPSIPAAGARPQPGSPVPFVGSAGAVPARPRAHRRPERQSNLRPTRGKEMS